MISSVRLKKLEDKLTTLPHIWKEAFAYDPHDFSQQLDFVDDTSRVRLAGAAVRTGKTYGAAENFVISLVEDYTLIEWGKETIYWCIAPTFNETVAQKRELVRLIPDAMIDHERQGKDTRWKDLTKSCGGTLCLKGNRLIRFKTAEKPESLVAEAVRGIWWTEIARSKKAAWANARSRLSNYADSWLIADTSPMGRCWFYQDVWTKENSSNHEWMAVDSPFIPASEIEAARESLTPEFFARDYEASWASFSGQIYENFSRGTHLIGGIPFLPESYVLGIDINTGSHAPAAFVKIAVGGTYRDPMGVMKKRAHVAAEYYETIGLDYDRYARDITEAYRACRAELPTSVFLDPSAHNDFKKELRRLKVPIRNAKNEVLKGIRTVGGALNMRQDLGLPLLTIDKTCTNIVSEIEGYSWQTSSMGVVTEKPNKDSPEHLLDSLRYSIMGIYGGADKPKAGGFHVAA